MICRSLSWSNHPNITGIIYAGAPGEQTGPGLVDVLWGLNPRYPGGKLPFAISDVGHFTVARSSSLLMLVSE